jgi:hypothetical protein
VIKLVKEVKPNCAFYSNSMSMFRRFSSSAAHASPTKPKRKEAKKKQARHDSDYVDVLIEKPALNTRIISCSLSVTRPIDDVWTTLTNYDELSTHIPNLVESYRVPKTDSSNNSSNSNSNSDSDSTSNIASNKEEKIGGGKGDEVCRVYQKASQKVAGFTFTASITMDMQEWHDDEYTRRITFRIVTSLFFAEFDGEWKMVEDPVTGITTISYKVRARPKGPVPVFALEWRLKKDLPTNLMCLKRACENLRPNYEHPREGVAPM